jgi:monoamine oxidase
VSTTNRQSHSRRRFLGYSAAAASSALLASMTGAAPATAAPAWAGLPGVPKDIGAGQRVLILGAGIAGLSAAEHLDGLGFSVRVLEALDRPGGRNFTARRDTVVTELIGGREVRQTCGFDDGLYINLGPGRIPYHHRRVLASCQQHGVALEPYVMETTANLYAGPSVHPNRRLANDTRGHLAYLLLKALDRGALATELSGLSRGQRQALRGLLVDFGDLKALDDGHRYVGSTRSGYRYPLTEHQMAEAVAPLALAELLDERFWEHRFYQPVDHLWQNTLFQPVGGMDHIVTGFTDRIGHLVSYGCPVTGIELVPDGVRVTWTEDGGEIDEVVDHCLGNIALPVLDSLALTNFSPDYREAIGLIGFDPACKVGWQANERFWESDAYQIYGGISWTDDICYQLWYPSNDYFSANGTLTGCYNFGDAATEFGGYDLRTRLDIARASGTRLHPEIADRRIVPDELGLSIAWQNVPYQAGGFAHWNPADADAVWAYGTLLAPDGRFHVIGDQVSSLPGWQEGALMSAEYVVKQVLGLERRIRPQITAVPDSRALIP